MIREAAYHGLLKRTRANLHVQFIDWLEQVAWDRILEFEEIHEYHLEQAFFILQQLTPNDEKVWRIGVRGIRLPLLRRTPRARGETSRRREPAPSSVQPAPARSSGTAACGSIPPTPPRSRVPSTKLVRCSTLQSRRRTSSRISAEVTASIQQLELLYDRSEASRADDRRGVEAHLPGSSCWRPTKGSRGRGD